MKPALTRLTLLVGASLTLSLVSGSGLALAAKGTQPTNAAQNQYLEQVQTVRPSKRHTSTSATRTTPTTTGGAPSTQVNGSTTPSSGNTRTTSVRPVTHKTGRRHHKTVTHRVKKSRKSAVQRAVAGRRAHALSSKPAHGAARLTMAAATGSGGSMGVWLLVILILVLVTGSAAGILRYRRNR